MVVPSPKVPTVPVRLCMRAIPLLKMTERERRLLEFVLAHGRAGRWTCYQGGNVSQALAVQMDWDERSARRAIATSKDRGWLISGLDSHGRPVIELTGNVFWSLCMVALERQKVRSALGWKLLGQYEVDDKTLDKINKLASGMYEPKRFADRVRQVARTILTEKYKGPRLATRNGKRVPQKVAV